ncbi:homing endonuclease associated repeat-containing protein [Fictibacillus sp. NRS-1165]|uniref:homing endonuclease associated repeat-containing protein n=1 Tax=Fictibacillus sp. NRS-1165 TaxID=3144463 RepID=UPI003D240C8D
MIQAIKNFAKDKETFTSLDYEKAKIQPSYPAIQERFGSWANAVRNAGIEPGYVYYTDREILDEIKRCLDLKETHYITIADYKRLSNHHDRL